MKRKGILNKELMKAIADMGHEQLIVIGDAGVPVNDQAKRIDLAIAEELPTVRQVLEPVSYTHLDVYKRQPQPDSEGMCKYGPSQDKA